jgi:hypothetical protein
MYYVVGPFPLAHQQTACSTSLFLATSASFASINTFLCAIAERYFKICHPFQYEWMMSKWIVIAMEITAYTLALSLGSLVYTNSHFYPDMICSLGIIMDMAMTIILITYALLVYVGFFYFSSAIIVTIRKHRIIICIEASRSGVSPHDSTKNDNIKKVKALGIMLLFMFACYVPYALLTFIASKTNLYYQQWFIVLHNCSKVICLFNNVANPIIYGWRDKKISNHFHKVVKSLTYNK